MNPHRGEVWLADLGLTAKTPPVVIVSRYEVPIPKLGFLSAVSVANVQGIASIPIVRLERRLEKLSDDVLAEIRRALEFALDLRDPS
jgi:mRNA interferase MazF